jgi:hypothetical protein
VQVDFKKFASHRDLDETKGHAPEKKIGPLRFRDLRGFKNRKFEGEKNWKGIPGEDGCVVEDGYGVLLIMHLTKVYLEGQIHVQCHYIFQSHRVLMSKPGACSAGGCETVE